MPPPLAASALEIPEIEYLKQPTHHRHKILTVFSNDVFAANSTIPCIESLTLGLPDHYILYSLMSLVFACIACILESTDLLLFQLNSLAPSSVPSGTPVRKCNPE